MSFKAFLYRAIRNIAQSRRTGILGHAKGYVDLNA